MDWFRRNNKKEETIRIPGSPGHRISFNYFLLLFRALRTCAVALLAVSGSLWLAWAVQSTFTQIDWSGGLDGSNATQTGWTKYSAKDAGIVAVADIKLQSTSYSVTDDGTLDTSQASAGTTGGTFGSASATKVNTALNPSAADSTASVKLLGTWVFVCGDTVTFTYKGTEVTYGTVLSQGKCWMDRNLGAKDPALVTTYNDVDGYGDLFQWGRGNDGHQSIYRVAGDAATSGTTGTLSSSDTPGHANFITIGSGPLDWRSPQNNNLWQGVSGTNNPCPSGWRIPTEPEWSTEETSWSQQNFNGAFASPLELTAAGFRDHSSAALSSVGSYGVYWSSTVSGTNARNLYFLSTTAAMGTNNRAYGFSVRCLKN